MIRLKDAIIGVAVMGAAGLIFILILGFQGSAECARADALQAELAECREIKVAEIVAWLDSTDYTPPCERAHVDEEWILVGEIWPDTAILRAVAIRTDTNMSRYAYWRNVLHSRPFRSHDTTGGQQ